MTIHVIHYFLMFLVGLFFTKVTEAAWYGTNKNKNAMYQVEVRRNSEPPTLDGVLSKDEWKHAAIVHGFTQKEPLEGMPASEPTIVLITYDDDNIYFGIRCFDREPKKVVANEMRRDYDLSDNDYVEIIIDTYHDQRNAYYFATNSLGARLDCEIKAEGTHLNWDWDGIWYSSAHRDGLGWTAELAIPFQTLRFRNRADLTWGINFGRYIPRKREESFWSPISRDDDFDDYGKFKASKFGVLRGLKNIQQHERIQVKPYTIGGIEKDVSLDAPVDKLADFGLDSKIHITSNIVSDLTINTDFAQVEADAEQANLSRFSLFFPEKREFFIEGLDIFNVGEGSTSDPFTLLFFSRQIGLYQGALEVPIIGGIKITGKEGPYELGLLDVYTNDLKMTNSDSILQHETNYSALRIKRDIFGRSYIGVMGLSKAPVRGGDYNRTFAVDGHFAFDNNIIVGGYFAKTQTPGLKSKDSNSYLEFSWGSDKIYTKGSFTDIGANFNPEMGFLQWRDIRKYNALFILSPRPDFLNTRQMHISYDIEYITDHDNVLQYRTFSPGILNLFNDESYVFLGLTNYYDNIPDPGFFLGPAFVPGGIYKYNVVGLTYRSDFSQKIAGSLGLGVGSFYDGTYWGTKFSGYLRPTDRIGFDLKWDWYQLDLPFPNGKFQTNIVGARINYSFTTNLFTKLFVQWNDLQERVISNFLVNFKYSPGSDFYLVYNEEWDTTGHLSISNHTFLAKLTYMLDF